MNIVTTEECNGIPGGSVIYDPSLEDGNYTGLWCSAGGSYTITVPASICIPHVPVDYSKIIREYLKENPNFDHSVFKR